MIRSAPLELTFLLLLLAAFGAAGYLATGFPEQARWLPLGASIPGALLVLWCLLQLHRRSRAGSGAAGESRTEPPPERAHGFRHLMVTLGVALTAAALGGFLYAVPASYLTYILLTQGRDRLVAAIVISAASAAVTYVVFGRLLGVPLTRSVF